MSDSYWSKFGDIQAFIFDVDGVFTDGRLLVTETGSLLRSMNVRDGYAVKRALQAGYKVGIITGGSSEGVRLRLEGLGIESIAMRQQDKSPSFAKMLVDLDVTADETVYMGDDVPDIPCLKQAGLACAPSDAIPEVLQVAQYISPQKGGDGCVRDIIEKVLRIQDKW